MLTPVEFRDRLEVIGQKEELPDIEQILLSAQKQILVSSRKAKARRPVIARLLSLGLL